MKLVSSLRMMSKQILNFYRLKTTGITIGGTMTGIACMSIRISPSVGDPESATRFPVEEIQHFENKIPG